MLYKKNIQQYLRYKNESRLFHKKKLELGKIQFVVDDVYFQGIKLKSQFRPVMVNQPGADHERTRFLNQLDKYTIKADFYSGITGVILLLLSYKVYVLPLLESLTALIYGQSLTSHQTTSLLHYMVPVLGLEDLDTIAATAFIEAGSFFTLLPF